jgi:O-antigen chain-terminating methyltransferase
LSPIHGAEGAAAAEEERRKTEELKALLQAIRDRVRAQYPEAGSAEAPPAPLIDLLPLLHARDAAFAKVASIGAVNPRRGGPLNAAVQLAKKLVARALDWHVREQVEFNRHAVRAMDAALEAMNGFNRALQALSRQNHELREQLRRAESRIDDRERQVADLTSHWAAWRPDWERKLAVNETQFLRSVADVQIAFQHRASLMESNFRDMLKAQHADYLGALDRSNQAMQERFWGEFDKVRTEYERWIHEELRVFRQRAAAAAAAREAAPDQTPALDYGWFAERFRGKESHVRASAERYVAEFRGCANVLDAGCGRGEFLEAMRSAGIPARGVDLAEDCVRHCRAKGLDAETADLFAYLEGLLPGSLDGLFSAQVVEHLPPARLPRMMQLAARALRPGGRIVIETPNPACLAIFATHFYLDPTHQRPVPADLLGFYLQESGFGQIRVDYLSPAEESMESLRELPEAFRRQFFGGLDYAIRAVRL